LKLVRRLRIPAILCALAVLLCELIGRPYANMGVCDDWPYILMARTLAATGHIVYNGWAAPMLAWRISSQFPDPLAVPAGADFPVFTI
jgi:hypothetical protein